MSNSCGSLTAPCTSAADSNTSFQVKVALILVCKSDLIDLKLMILDLYTLIAVAVFFFFFPPDHDKLHV